MPLRFNSVYVSDCLPPPPFFRTHTLFVRLPGTAECIADAHIQWCFVLSGTGHSVAINAITFHSSDNHRMRVVAASCSSSAVAIKGEALQD